VHGGSDQSDVSAGLLLEDVHKLGQWYASVWIPGMICNHGAVDDGDDEGGDDDDGGGDDDDDSGGDKQGEKQCDGVHAALAL